MSSTSPIERLNYFNGQRLEAADLRLEQDFHIRVRRLLNRSLFTPGIAAGLEVEKVPPEPSHAVTVMLGLAIDSLGREIILVEPRHVSVAGKPSKPKEPVIGNYLVIEYAEDKTAEIADGCAVQLGVTCKATEDLSWGAPSRIRAEPHISIQSQWPKAEDNKIVLAQLELNADCSVRAIRTFVRKYVAVAKEAKAQALALEGERDIDEDNPKELCFRVFSGSPDNAALILRGAKFSSLYYTELGSHSHELIVKLEPNGAIAAHSHTLGELKTSFIDPPKHIVTAFVDDNDPDENGIMMQARDDGVVNMTERAGLVVTHEAGHEHIIAAGQKTDNVPEIKAHNHNVTSSLGNTGVSVAARIGGKAHSFIDGMKIAFDGTDITSLVLQQLRDRDEPQAIPPTIWETLGDGKESHKLSAKDPSGKVEGTGEIDLLRLGIDLAPGEHRLTFSVEKGGGLIRYNLYVA